MPLSSRFSARRVAVVSVLTALALFIGWLERPLMAAIPLPLPGFKLGFANIITLFALYRLGAADAAAILFLRIVLAGVLSGTPVSFVLSFCGGALAFFASCAVYRRRSVSPVGTSLLSAAAHMTGQVIAAALLLSSPLLFTSYLPYLLLLSLFSGGLCGIAVVLLLKRIPHKLM